MDMGYYRFNFNFKIWLATIFIICAGGFAMFVYGLTIIPQKLPDAPSNNLYQYPNKPASYSELTDYQIHSLGFILTMSGIGCCVFGIFLLCYLKCKINKYMVRVNPSRSSALGVVRVDR